MAEKAPLTGRERAERIRTAMVMGGYDPGTAKVNAGIELLVDLICLSAAYGWPFEQALERARAVTGLKAPQPPVPKNPSGILEPWVTCETCHRLHPTWAACLAADALAGGKTKVVVTDVSGRRAGHVEPWFGKLPGVLMDVEREMGELVGG